MNTCAKLTAAALNAAMEKFESAKLALIGDLCLDYYLRADMRLSELSRETPHFPLPVVSERASAGGAANVAVNVAALKPGKFSVIGLCGSDWRGDLLIKALREGGVDTKYVLRSDEVTTNTYMKMIRTGISDIAYEDPRVDFENRKPLSEALEDAVCSALDEADYDVLLVSDQLRFGIVTPKVRAHICAIAEAGKTVIVDSRDRIAEYHHVIVKPNEVEAARCFGSLCADTAFDPNDPGSLLRFAERIIPKIAAKNHARAIITLGSQGCMIYDGEAGHCPAYSVKPPVDIVGAGDTFLAAVGTTVASGAELATAANIAALASSVTVKKIGTTGTASREELAAALNNY